MYVKFHSQEDNMGCCKKEYYFSYTRLRYTLLKKPWIFWHGKDIASVFHSPNELSV